MKNACAQAEQPVPVSTGEWAQAAPILRDQQVQRPCPVALAWGGEDGVITLLDRVKQLLGDPRRPLALKWASTAFDPRNNAILAWGPVAW